MNTMWAPSRCSRDLVDRLLGRRSADFGVGAGAQALGDLDAQLDARSVLERVSCWASVLATTNSTPSKPGLDHVVDGVAAGPADAEHDDTRLQLPDIRHLEVDRHGSPLLQGRVTAPLN